MHQQVTNRILRVLRVLGVLMVIFVFSSPKSRIVPRAGDISDLQTLVSIRWFISNLFSICPGEHSIVCIARRKKGTYHPTVSGRMITSALEQIMTYPPKGRFEGERKIIHALLYTLELSFSPQKLWFDAHHKWRICSYDLSPGVPLSVKRRGGYRSRL